MSPLDDRLAIADLTAAWGHRDAGRWAELLDLFEPDARIELSWYNGSAADFVARSQAMKAGPLQSKHFLGTPRIDLYGDRARSETDAMIVVDQVDLGIGALVHGRFVDRLSRTDGRWRIAHRAAVYDSSTFTFPFGIVPIDNSSVRRFPREYAPLAYLLHASGFPLTEACPTRGSHREAEIHRAADNWLHH